MTRHDRNHEVLVIAQKQIDVLRKENESLKQELVQAQREASEWKTRALMAEHRANMNGAT